MSAPPKPWQRQQQPSVASTVTASSGAVDFADEFSGATGAASLGGAAGAATTSGSATGAQGNGTLGSSTQDGSTTQDSNQSGLNRYGGGMGYGGMGMGGLGMGMGGMYGGYGGMGGMGMMGMGMGMNRMGMGGMNGGGWFGNDSASLDQLMYMMNMNSWFFDQLSDQAMCMWMRLRDMLLWLYRMKNWVIRGDYRQATEIEFESEDERREWEQKLLKRIYCVGAFACVLAMWTFRKMFTRRQQRAQWHQIFGNGPRRGLPGPLRPSL